MFSFTVTHQLHQARRSILTTPHGPIAGPFFQFVATQGAIRGQVFSEDLTALGVEILLANTYHLHVRPGADLIAAAGGLHQFMQWSKPLTTDSGGYQVFSLSQRLQRDRDGVTFRSPIDGSQHRLTPESVINIQTKLGADLIMPFDVATPFTADRAEVEQAVEQTITWAKRCQAEHERQATTRPVPQALYGIVQGGLFPDLREHCAQALRDIGFFGYSIGGELRDVEESRMADGVAMTVPHLPADAPRYLMGAGTPEDIVRAVRAGVDQFDCVLPIRNARHGRLYLDLNVDELRACLRDPERPVEATKLYRMLDIRKSAHATSSETITPPGHPVMKQLYTVGYLHHLLRAEPPSGYRLAVLINIHFYVELMRAIREIIEVENR